MTVTALAAQAAVAGDGRGAAAAIAVGVAILLAVAIMVRRRRAAALPTGGPDAAQLAAAASSALRHADDAVLTSEQELGFATAVFGERAMRPFSAAVESAREQRREAFRLWQLIGDEPPEAAGARPLFAHVIQRCGATSRLLDAQADEFDKARNAGARTQQLVAEVDAHIAQQCARVSQSRDALSRLSAKYTPDAVVAVAANPDHAATRLQFAADCLASAKAATAAGAAQQAALLLQAAEAAADQATDLLTGVLHREAELTQAASAVPAALREIDAEIAEASAHLTGEPDGERGTLVAGARVVSGDVQAKLAAGPFDALVALRNLQQADADLDRVLAVVRTGHARRQRSIAVLDEAMLVARSSVTAAEDFITTRRGGVGTTARSRLAEASRRFQEAIGVRQADPEAALSEAQCADALARQAQVIAEQDVASFDDGTLSAEGAAAWSAWTRCSGTGLRGAILGGVVIEDQAGGVGPASFGGVGTRGRHAVRAGRLRPVGHADVADIADEAGVSGSV